MVKGIKLINENCTQKFKKKKIGEDPTLISLSLIDNDWATMTLS